MLLTPTIVLTLSADAQHRRSALLSALINPSHQGTTTHVQVMRPQHLIHASTLPICFPLYRSTTIYAYPLSHLSVTLPHLRPASPLDNCPSQTDQPNRPVTGPKPTGRSICCNHL